MYLYFLAIFLPVALCAPRHLRSLSSVPCSRSPRSPIFRPPTDKPPPIPHPPPPRPPTGPFCGKAVPKFGEYKENNCEFVDDLAINKKIDPEDYEKYPGENIRHNKAPVVLDKKMDIGIMTNNRLGFASIPKNGSLPPKKIPTAESFNQTESFLKKDKDPGYIGCMGEACSSLWKE